MLDSIFTSVLNACSNKDVTEILLEISDKVSFVPVGGKRNNSGIINMGSDPASGLTERITNAIDAVLEKKWRDVGEPKDINSPRRAAEHWFNIPDGHLSNIEDARDERLESLSKLVNVSFLDSGINSKPTVEIRDKGIGIKGEMFSKTILDLNGENKIGKLHLMGAFGQGGSTALSFSNYTIIISKPAFGTEKETSKAYWTIVRMNPGNPNVDKTEWYEYAVDKRNGQPFSLEIDDDTFGHGTLIRHLMMDLGKYKGNITNPTNSLWYLSHHYLFDPVIPFSITEGRNDYNKGNRKVTGNNRLLSTTQHLEYSNSSIQTFRDGTVRIFWWVLSTSGENPKDRIKHYTLSSQPIILTFNGQRQGVESSHIIKSDLKLPFLERYLIVQIEADNLDNDSKRQLFSSTRENIRDTSIREELKQLLLNVLGGDKKLAELDKERRRRYFTKEDSEVMDKLRQRLANRINRYLQSSGQGNTPKVKAEPTGTDVNPELNAEIKVEDPPTFIDITSPSPRIVHVGKPFSIRFKTDAHPSYFVKPDTFQPFVEPADIALFTGTTKVIDGYGSAYFRVTEEYDVGMRGKITLELRPPRHRSLSSSIEIELQDSPENKGEEGKGKGKSPNINVDFIYKDSDLFKDYGWNDLSVAKVFDDNESINISVSGENRNLVKLVERAQRYSENAVDNIKNRYLEHISFHSYLLHRQDFLSLIKDEKTDIDDEYIEMIKETELKNVSETVCGMIKDFFDQIITESVE